MSLDYFGQSTYKEKWNGLDLVYSCDKIVLAGRFEFEAGAHVLKYLEVLYHYGGNVVGEIPFGYYMLNVRYYDKYAAASYKHNFVLEFMNHEREKVSFYFALGLNTPEGYKDCWKLEFNPNKILTNCGPWMRDFLLKLKGYTKLGANGAVEIKSFDVAIDFPVPRDCVLYDRGNRTHKLFMISAQERTDYYGTGHKHGATKIYNKGLESGWPHDLTRLEVTLEIDDYDSVRRYFEGLRILRHGQMALQEIGGGLTQNDKVVLDLLNLHPEYLLRMNWAARKKFKPYLEDFVQPFVLGLKAFNHIAGWRAQFCRLNIGGIFGDG